MRLYLFPFAAQEALISALKAEVARLTTRWEQEGPAPPKAVTASKAYSDAVARTEALSAELKEARATAAVLTARNASLTSDLLRAQAALATAAASDGAATPVYALLSGLSVSVVQLGDAPAGDEGGSSAALDCPPGAGFYECSVSEAGDAAGESAASITVLLELSTPFVVLLRATFPRLIICHVTHPSTLLRFALRPQAPASASP